MGKNKAIIVVIAFVGVIIAALLVRQSQELRRLAQEPAKVAHLAISSEKLEGNLIRVDMMFKTGPEEGNARQISSMSFRLHFPKDGNAYIVNENGFATDKIVPNKELDDTKWMFPVNSVLVEEEEQVIDFSAVYIDTKGFTTSKSEKIAHFYLRFDDGNTDDLHKIRIDSDMSAIMTKKSPVKNILNVSEGGLLSIEFTN